MSGGRLQQELKKKRPFDSPEQEAILSIARTADRFGICFARLFREHGLTPSQYNVLRILRGEGKPLPILEIADRMIAAVPGITGLIDRLEGMGLVDQGSIDRGSAGRLRGDHAQGPRPAGEAGPAGRGAAQAAGGPPHRKRS